MNIVEKMLERIRALYNDMAYVWGRCNELSEWNSWAEITGNWGLLQDLIMRAVLCVELVTGDLKAELKEIATSADKRKAAIAYVDSLIKLPPYMEWVDNLVIGGLVDAAVAALNKKYGKDWGVADKQSVARIAKAEGVGR